MSEQQTVRQPRITVVLSCHDLDAALAFYTGQLGFRIEAIFPADAPRVAVLSGFGIRVRLESGRAGSPPGLQTALPSLIVTSARDGAFGDGRAGMQYRDLIPGRYAGRFIASHIRIAQGGPVADYVHHHDVRLQMIFCVSGWVTVVYEGQGEPLRMRPGDCFLQPPHIRHRVLECSPGMEVLEIASPAEHETCVDHDMVLPTPRYPPDHDFGGQKFVFHRLRQSAWSASDVDGFEHQDTGIAGATGGAGSAIVLRNAGCRGEVALTHEAELRFLFVLGGSASLRGRDRVLLRAHDSCAIPAGVECSLCDISTDFRVLDVSIPSRQAGRRVR